MRLSMKPRSGFRELDGKTLVGDRIEDVTWIL